MKKKPITTWFYPLFAHMAETHALAIVESEAEDIIAAVEQCQKRRADMLAPTVARAVRKMAEPLTDNGCYCQNCVSLAASRKARKLRK